MNNKYTSLALSKKLEDNGLKYHTGAIWVKPYNFKKHYLAVGQSEIRDYYDEKDKTTSFCFAYDIIYDICIKYKEQFFTKKLVLGQCFRRNYDNGFNYYPLRIF